MAPAFGQTHKNPKRRKSPDTVRTIETRLRWLANCPDSVRTIGAAGRKTLGQLNTYVAWYQKNLMQDGDNPPVGLLLCTGKDHALVEYALSSMNHPLFVSKYQFELPSKETLQQFLQDKRKEVSGVI
jgi:hypothetical protein